MRLLLRVQTPSLYSRDVQHVLPRIEIRDGCLTGVSGTHPILSILKLYA